MANGQIDGKTWSIPFQRSTIVLYWNKDAFKDAGLDPEKAPASWDEMVATGKKLVKKDGSGNVTRWGVEIPTTGYPSGCCRRWRSNKQRLMNEAGTEVYLTAPKIVAALDYSVDLSRKEKVMPTAASTGRRCAGLPRRQDRDDVAHHRQPHRGEGRRQIRFRRRHAARERRREVAHHGGGSSSSAGLQAAASPSSSG